MRARGRVMMDILRYGQNGDYSGHFTLPDGTRHEVSGPAWRGYRDRSWGIRPVGEKEPSGIHAASKANYLWLYCCCQFDDHMLMLKVQDLASGKRVMQEAVRIWNDPSRKVEHLGRIDHALTLDAKKHLVTGGLATCRDVDGSELRVEVEQLLPAYLMAGTGYDTGDPDWGHGRHQGPLKTESLVYEVGADGIGVPSVIDSVGRYRCNGQVGHGLFEYAFMGDFPRYGVAGTGYWNGPKG